MERFPGGEGKVEKGAVLEAIRTKGLEDPETMALVVRWTKEREEERNRAASPRVGIQFEIDRADLYIAAGDIGGAIEGLEWALEHARGENQTDLYEKIKEKIERLQDGDGMWASILTE